MRCSTGFGPSRLLSRCVTLPAQLHTFCFFAVNGPNRGDREPRSRRIVEPETLRQPVSRPLERLPQHRFDQCGGFVVAMPRCPPTHPCRYPAIRRVEVRKVVRHSEDIVEPGIVVGQHRAITIRKNAFKLANSNVLFRAASLAPPASMFERNLAVLSLLLRCLVRII
jgi:hypothetical protein